MASVKVVYALAALALLGLALSGTFAGLYFSGKSAVTPVGCIGSGGGAASSSSNGTECAETLAAAQAAAGTAQAAASAAQAAASAAKAEAGAAQAAAATSCKRCAALLSLAHAVGVCDLSSNECKIAACNAGYASCDGLVESGCEAALASDVNNCGSCGNKCPSFPNAEARCIASSCTTCNNATGECNAQGMCATDLRSASNCGSCGKVCPSTPNGVAACSNGSCTVICNDGFLDCGDGVCTDSRTDRFNCGTCGKVCTYPGQLIPCVNGQCATPTGNGGGELGAAVTTGRGLERGLLLACMSRHRHHDWLLNMKLLVAIVAYVSIGFHV
jgi:hypothetical protein